MKSRALIPVLVLTFQAASLPLLADVKAEQELLHAVVQNQVGEVKRLLDSGVSPNVRPTLAKDDAWVGEHGQDPQAPLIVVASRFGCPDDSAVVRLLVSKGADVNASDKFGRTPLMFAAQLAWGPSVNVLLEHGAKVNARDYEGKTPVMCAVGNRGLSVVAKLLDKGAEINAKDKIGYTALMHAIRQARHDPVRLIKPAVDEDLIAAAPNIIDSLQKQTPQSRQAEQARRAQEEKDRYLELVRYLIQKGADANAQSKAGDTAMTLAKQFGAPDVMELLTKAGAKH